MRKIHLKSEVGGKNRFSEIFQFFIVLVHFGIKPKSNQLPRHVELFSHAPQFRGGVISNAL